MIRMEDDRLPKKVLKSTQKSLEKDLWENQGREEIKKGRWENGVAEDARRMGVRGWRRAAEDREGWRQKLGKARGEGGGSIWAVEP